MQVILLERVAKLGQMGEVVNVRPGYARNFLIPQGKALRATTDSLSAFEARRAQLEADNLERKGDAQMRALEVDGSSVVVLRQASEGEQLYGSVTARDIVAAFAVTGVRLGRQQIRLDSPLKTLGIHDVTVALHPEVEVTVQVNVARTAEEADIQAGRAAPVEPEAGPDEDSDEFFRGTGLEDLE